MKYYPIAANTGCHEERPDLSTVFGGHLSQSSGPKPRLLSALSASLYLSQNIKTLDRSRLKSLPNHTLLDDDQFQSISDWVHVAILSLCDTTQNKASPASIAKALGVTPAQASSALSRLVRLGLIREQKGRLKRTGDPLFTQSLVPSPAIRHFHQQVLDLARASIEGTPMDARHLSAVTVPMDKKKLKQARQLITEFQSRFAALMETSAPEDLYFMTIQLFPVTQSKSPSQGAPS